MPTSCVVLVVVAVVVAAVTVFFLWFLSASPLLCVSGNQWEMMVIEASAWIAYFYRMHGYLPD